jgi:predicted acyltransferase (DUF342 family)
LIITGFLNVKSKLNVGGDCNIQGSVVSPSSITCHSLTTVKNIISTDGDLYIKGSSDLNGLVNIYDSLNVGETIEALNINVGDSVNIKNHLFSDSIHATSLLCDDEVVSNLIYSKHDLRVEETSFLYGQVNMYDGLSVKGKAIINNQYCEGLNLLTAPYDPKVVQLEVKGATVIKGELICCDDLIVNGNLKIFGNIYCTGEIFQKFNMEKPQNLSDAFYDA